MRELSIEEIDSDEISGGVWPAVAVLFIVAANTDKLEKAASEFFEGYGEARNK